MGDYYGTGIEIWAGFRPVGITEKNNICEQLFRPVFSSFHGQNKIKTLFTTIVRMQNITILQFIFAVQNDDAHQK